MTVGTMKVVNEKLLSALTLVINAAGQMTKK